MRVLAAADIHGVSVIYEWLVQLTRSRCDVLVLAGDLLSSDFAAEQRKQADRIIDILRASSVPVLYIMGNDDHVSLEYSDGLIKPIHGQRIVIGDYNFVGYQYTPPFVGDMFVKRDAEIANDLPTLEPLVDERTVFVTHTPALGTLDRCCEEHVGSRAIADFVRRNPVLAHIHGHVHEEFGRDRHHFNVAAAGCCRALLIELPALDHFVTDYHSDPPIRNR